MSWMFCSGFDVLKISAVIMCDTTNCQIFSLYKVSQNCLSVAYPFKQIKNCYELYERGAVVQSS